MAKYDLTAERLKELLHYDPETGVFTWRVYRGGTAKQGTIAGGLIPAGYRIIRLGVNQYAHRLVWLYVYGRLPTQDIDHIDGNRDNNAFANLREATRSENLQNQRRAKSKIGPGVLGVSWAKHRNKWLAQITYDGKQHNLGLYNTIEQASAAYLAAKREKHPFCTI